jgi:hypothetical protein
MAFEKYMGGRGGIPTVTFCKTKGRGGVNIYFNALLEKIVGKENYKFCELYFDEETQRVGFKICGKQTESTRKIKRTNAFSVRGFLLAHGLNSLTGKTFALKNDDSLGEENFFTFSIHDPIKIKSSINPAT